MEEMRAPEMNGTWDLVGFPRVKTPIACKWVFTVKYKVDGHKLKRSLYGLNQSLTTWYNCFTKFIQNLRYMQSQTNHTMFYKHFGDSKIVILRVYVDDIILTNDNLMELEQLKGVLAKEF